MRVNILKALVVIVSLAQCAGDKRLLPNPGFDNPEAWESEYLPCALEEVIFPQTYEAILPLPTKVDISGFILPRDGAILLNDESTITLGGELQQRECENGRSRRAFLKMPTTRKWYDPGSWLTSTNQAQNQALPHLERVPCDNETVVIQSDGPLSIDLENIAYVRMGNLYLGESLISSNYLNYLIHTDIGQFLFKNSLDTIAQYYHQDTCGCQMNALSFIEPICKHVIETCEQPHCLVPIMPREHCCPICGSILRFAIDDCSDSNLNALRKVIANAIKEQELTDDLDYHINYVNIPPYDNYLEAIIVDRDDYSEKSVRFLTRLNATTDWAKIFDTKHQLEMIVSGRPYNPNITFGSVFLIILSMLFVSVTALVIFAQYSPDNPYLRHVPQWIYDPRRWRTLLLRSSVMFARFDNGTTGGSGVMDNITVGYDAENEQVRERAFNNPMFGETLRQTLEGNISIASSTGGTSTTTISVATVDVPKVKERKLAIKSRGKKLERVTLVDAMESDDVEEEQELTEITLDDKLDDDSEEEEETKE